MNAEFRVVVISNDAIRYGDDLDLMKVDDNKK